MTGMGCCSVHINETTGASAALKAFQIDSSATLETDSNSFVTLVTLAGDAKVLNGEEWKINMCVLVCSPEVNLHQPANAETQWEIETSTGVFAEFDRYSTNWGIEIFGDELSSPAHRTKNLVTSMDVPRMRVRVRRTDPGAADYLWELPRWGGVLIDPAP